MYGALAAFRVAVAVVGFLLGRQLRREYFHPNCRYFCGENGCRTNFMPFVIGLIQTVRKARGTHTQTQQYAYVVAPLEMNCTRGSAFLSKSFRRTHWHTIGASLAEMDAPSALAHTPADGHARAASIELFPTVSVN